MLTITRCVCLLTVPSCQGNNLKIHTRGLCLFHLVTLSVTSFTLICIVLVHFLSHSLHFSSFVLFYWTLSQNVEFVVTISFLFSFVSLPEDTLICFFRERERKGEKETSMWENHWLVALAHTQTGDPCRVWGSCTSRVGGLRMCWHPYGDEPQPRLCALPANRIPAFLLGGDAPATGPHGPEHVVTASEAQKWQEEIPINDCLEILWLDFWFLSSSPPAY